MGKFERIRNIRQRRRREQQMRPGNVQKFVTAVLFEVTAGCVPKQRRFKVPFSFENPVYGLETVEDIVNGSYVNTMEVFVGDDQAPEDVSKQVSVAVATPQPYDNDCSESDLKELESAKKVHETSSIQQERKPGRLERFLSPVRSVFNGFVPTAKRFNNPPFSFENPVYESKSIEDLLNLSDWTTLSDENSQNDSYVGLNNVGPVSTAVLESDAPSKDSGKQPGNFHANDTENSAELQIEHVAEHRQTSSSRLKPVRRDSTGKNRSKLKRSLSWSHGADSFWDGCTQFKREGLFSCGLLRTTNPELRERRLAEREKEKEMRKRKKKEDKFWPAAKYGYEWDTPLDVYIYNECLWPEENGVTVTEGDGVTKGLYEKKWEYHETDLEYYNYFKKDYYTESDEESWGSYDSEDEDEEDNAIPKQPPKKAPPMVTRSSTWPLQLNKACTGVPADDGMESCGILISTEREKRQRKEPGLKIRNDTLECILWRFYYEGQE